MKSKVNPHIGSNFDSFLHEQSIYQEVEAAALKKVIATALSAQMKRKGITISRLAAALGTSRAAVDRVLDGQNTSITLNTLSRTAAALGCKVRLDIVAA